MEGLLDRSLRDLITRVGGVDLCVSEFIRITDQLLPARLFTRLVPELLQGGRTPAGTPVRAQLCPESPQYDVTPGARAQRQGSYMSRISCRNSSTSSKLRYTDAKRT